MLQEFIVAYNSNDTTTLSSLYASDAEYVSPHVHDLNLRGRSAVIENFARGVATGGHLDSVTVLSYDFFGDFAYLVCTYDATNSGVTVSGRNILILKKVDGRWLITVHASIIRD